MRTTVTVRVIGCGNADAGDDAAGLLAVEMARARLEAIPGVEVVEAGSGLRVLDLLEDADAVVVVDAVRSRPSELAPGTIVRAEAGPGGLAMNLRTSLSSHGFGLAETVGLGAALGRVRRLVFVGVEAGRIQTGSRLSTPVTAVLPQLVRGVISEVKRLMGDDAA